MQAGKKGQPLEAAVRIHTVVPNFGVRLRRFRHSSFNHSEGGEPFSHRAASMYLRSGDRFGIADIAHCVLCCQRSRCRIVFKHRPQRPGLLGHGEGVPKLAAEVDRCS